MLTGEEQENKEQERPPIETVIFDLDGLLIDSEVVWNRAYYKFIEMKSLPHEPVVSAQFVGKGLKEIIQLWQERYGLKGNKDKLLEEYRNVFYDILFNSENFRLMDGAEELIKSLDGRYKLAVATGGHTQEKCSQILKNLGLGSYFEVVASSDDVKEGKPAPDLYLDVAKRLGVSPSVCLALEDSANGVLSAKRAGMQVFAINPEPPLREELEKQHPEKVLSSLREVQL